MAKALSPVRLQEELMQAANRTGPLFHRSAAQQVEYWASIGRRLAGILDPAALAAVISGLARVRVEPVVGEPVDPAAVLRALETARQSGKLAAAIAQHPLRYQVSRQHPGYLEQIDADGTVQIGQFKDGRFHPRAPTAR